MLQRLTQGFGRRSNIGGDGMAERWASSEDVRELMRYALREALSDGLSDVASDNSVRQILRLACDAARKTNTTVEHAIVVLKDSLYEVPETRGRTHSETMAIVARVVTLCIEEYYVPRESS